MTPLGYFVFGFALGALVVLLLWRVCGGNPLAEIDVEISDEGDDDWWGEGDE